MSKIIPYKGTEPYIFISYAHKDGAAVRAVLTRMQKDGYRVWFDEGIDPGTEWDEVIASHVETCGYFLAFVSENYLASENCKDELNYARDLDKKRLLVYLQDVKLPGGMAMRMNRLQNVGKYRYANEEDFYENLYAAEGISAFCSSVDAASVKAAAKVTPAASAGLRFSRDRETGGFSVSGIDDSAGADIVIPAMHEGKPVTRIGPMAFSKRTARVSSVTIPSSVVSVGTAFSHCRGLDRLAVDMSNPSFHAIGNCLIETKSHTLVAGFDNSVIPTDGSVTSIGAHAFEGCRGKIKITLPNTVTTVHSCAFSKCPSLCYAEIPASMKNFSFDIFKGCRELTDLFYDGTQADFSSLERASAAFSNGKRWDDGMVSYTVHCLDGKLERKRK